MKDVIGITKDLIRIESTNPGAQEQGVCAYIQRILESAGVKPEKDEMTSERANLIATIPADREILCQEEPDTPMLVLICHMDTVVVGEGWTENPFGAEEREGRIYGRGACDMKSGLACALSAFCRIAEEVQAGSVALIRPLRLICTVDEEGFMTGVEHVIQNGYVRSCDWVMDLEPTDGQVQMAHKGRFWAELNVHGITAHASRPEQGVDAIAAAAQIICEIRRQFQEFPADPQLGRSTVTFGQIQGGYQPYVVPDLCKVWLDMRLAPPVNDEKVLKMLGEEAARVEREMPGIRAEWKITGNRPYIEANRESGLLKHLKRAVRHVTGEEPVEEVFPGYTDTAVIAGILGNQECMSYGPGSLKKAHKPDEYVEIEDIRRCEKVLLELGRAVLLSETEEAK